jgi:uncharacterized protein (DUF433 family)
MAVQYLSRVVDLMSTEIGTLLVSSPDVCGGRLRIDGTRITINQIAALYKQGFDAEEIADQYPHLTLAQVYTALAHYHANREEVEADLAAEGQATAITGSSESECWLETFKELQRSLNLTPAKAAEWQDAVREARR